MRCCFLGGGGEGGVESAVRCTVGTACVEALFSHAEHQLPRNITKPKSTHVRMNVDGLTDIHVYLCFEIHIPGVYICIYMYNIYMTLGVCSLVYELDRLFFLDDAAIVKNGHSHAPYSAQPCPTTAAWLWHSPPNPRPHGVLALTSVREMSSTSLTHTHQPRPLPLATF